jgi:DNA-binding beta-propeller fold protein YncE
MKSEPIPAENRRKRTAYVCNLGSTDDKSGWISVIDLENRTLTKNIKVGKFPVFSYIYPHDRRKLIVTLHNYMSKIGGGFLVLVDLQKGKVIRKLPYPGIAIPSGMVYDGKRDILYVADENQSQGYVHVHDGKTLKLLSSFPAGNATAHVDISSNGRHLVATNRLSANLSVFDLEKNSVTAQNGIIIPLGDTCQPFDVKFSEKPDICYVTDFETGELLVVDIARSIVTDRIKVGEMLFGMALDKVGTTAYICDLKSNSVSMVDIGSKKIDKITWAEGVSSHCAIDEKGLQLVVSCQGGYEGGPLHIIDLVTKTVIATIVDEKLHGSIGVTIDV